MHALAEDLVGLGDIRIGQLGGREFGFHEIGVRVSLPRLRMLLGSKLCLTRSRQRGDALRLRMKHIDRSPHFLVGPQQGCVAADRGEPLAQQRGLGVGAGGSAAQINPPPQS